MTQLDGDAALLAGLEGARALAATRPPARRMAVRASVQNHLPLFANASVPEYTMHPDGMMNMQLGYYYRRWGGDGTLGLDGAGHAVTRDPPVRRGRSGGIRPSARLEVWVGWRRRHGAEPAPSRDRAPGREGGWCCSGVAPLDDQIRRSPRGGAREEGVLAELRRRA